jgi:DNA-binding LacI/PurR family transcriptional regulator
LDIILSKESKLTLAKLAQLAGVSTSTASRALNNNPLINKKTREKIQQLALKHNFSLNRSASRLRTQKTHVIAVILNFINDTDQSISDPFLLQIVSDVNQQLNNHGYELLLSNSFMASDDWANYFINSSRADGLIIIGQGKTDQKIISAVNAGAPLVVWGDPTVTNCYPIVGSNNNYGGYLATEHLLRGGCKKILFLGDTEHAEIRQRHKGYTRALNENDIHVDQKLTISIDITSKAAYEKMNQLILDNGLFFDGIVAASDMVALGALKALKERNLNIPNDVAIVGFDDIAMAELFHPSLTTIRQNTALAAKLMVEQLINQFKQQKVNSQTIDINLIVRNSSKTIKFYNKQ